MEMMSYAFVPSFISMSATVRKFEGVPEAILCCSNNMWSSWKHDVVMEMMQHVCIPSFISMRATVRKIDEKRLKLFEQYVVVRETCCHGNDVIRMCIKFHLHVCYL